MRAVELRKRMEEELKRKEYFNSRGFSNQIVDPSWETKRLWRAFDDAFDGPHDFRDLLVRSSLTKTEAVLLNRDTEEVVSYTRLNLEDESQSLVVEPGSLVRLVKTFPGEREDVVARVRRMFLFKEEGEDINRLGVEFEPGVGETLPEWLDMDSVVEVLE
jgi:hypothetical protein